MNEACVDRIARAVLYEGYILYPYRPSVKNLQRWTFGSLCPRAYSEAHQGAEPWSMQTQCLVRGSAQTTLRVKVRGLHVQQRTAGALDPPLAALPEDIDPPCRFVDSLWVDDQHYQTWQEAVEQAIAPEPTTLHELTRSPCRHDFTLPAHRSVEPIRNAADEIAAALLRDRKPVEGRVEISAEEVSTELYRVTVTVSNHTPWEAAAGTSRDEALLRSLASTHIILGLQDEAAGEFISLTDPPESCQAAASECRNIGCWPVLVGDHGERDTILASPIILYDHPRIAPESLGDLFDATEIDELLTLRIMTLTDEEKREMAAVDDRARALLQRTESLAREQLMGLHGSMRNTEAEDGHGPDKGTRSESASCSNVRVGGVELRPGDRIRLRPRRRADAFDLALDGQPATIAAIERDYENRIHVAVTVDEDPGKDLGAMGKPAHRFFFGVDEIEPVVSASEETGETP